MKRIGYLIAGIVVIALVIGISATAKSPKKVDVGATSELRALQPQVKPAPTDESKEKNPDIPRVIAYYGYLEDANGPVTGTKNIKFRILDNWQGGNELWSHQYSRPVLKGRFNAYLGYDNEIPDNIFTGGTSRWLEVIVEGDTIPERTHLVSSGYAYASRKSDDADMVDGHHAGLSVGNVALLPSASVNQCLKYNGSSWVAGTCPQGPKGDKGDTGAQGPQGLKGDKGNTGNTGATGATGPKGDKGDTGDRGPRGYEGPEGPEGPVNPNADKVDGYDASVSAGTPYTIVVRGGNGQTDVQGSRNGALGNFYNTHSEGLAVHGRADASGAKGVHGYSNNGYGVYSAGDFGCSGSKAAMVRTSRGPTEMYAMESPDLWFEDMGSARLINGRAYISLDKDFLETVTIDGSTPMKVFIQLTDNCNGVYVRKGIDGFEVIELNGGTNNASFDYRALAKRKGYETQRMEVVECNYTDRFLYPDDNDPQIPAKWREQRRKLREAEAR